MKRITTAAACTATMFAAASLLFHARVALGEIIYVDASAIGAADGTSWPDAYPWLWIATVFSDPGDEIWVAEGTYKPIGDRTATFTLKNGVAIYGGFPPGGGDGTFEARDPDLYVTTLSGDLLSDDGPNFTNYGDNSLHVVTAADTDLTTTLDGLTICRGNANIFIDASVGGGIYATGDLTLIDTIIELNQAYTGGSGAVMADGILDHCIIRDNGNGGIGLGADNSQITDSVFESNARGALFFGNGTVSDSVFTGNFDGGAVGTGSGDSVFFNCLFTTNAGGGLGTSGGITTVMNCIFAGNPADSAAVVDHGLLILVNSLFVSNEFVGLRLGPGDGSATISNCIFWNHVFQIVVDKETGPYTINNSTLEDWDGSLGGVENNGDDPHFVDLMGSDGVPGTGDEDYHLLPDSLCIDTGDNASVPADLADLDGDGDTTEPTPIDLEGNARFYDPIRPEGIYPVVDRGTYEALERTDPCYSDVNFDGLVDPLDVGFVLARLGCTYPTDGENCLLSDVNADGLVDPLDAGYVLARFGTCE